MILRSLAVKGSPGDLFLAKTRGGRLVDTMVGVLRGRYPV